MTPLPPAGGGCALNMIGVGKKVVSLARAGEVLSNPWDAAAGSETMVMELMMMLLEMEMEETMRLTVEMSVNGDWAADGMCVHFDGGEMEKSENSSLADVAAGLILKCIATLISLIWIGELNITEET